MYDKDFCDLYPGAVITINSYAWANKYDTYWSSDGYKRQPVQACQSSSINYVYTCPVPPPPCYTCWKWTLTGCKDNYYGGDMCYRALGKLKFYLQSIGHEGGSLHDRGGGGPVARRAGLAAWQCAGKHMASIGHEGEQYGVSSDGEMANGLA